MPKFIFTAELTQADADKIASALEVGLDGIEDPVQADSAMQFAEELRAFAAKDYGADEGPTVTPWEALSETDKQRVYEFQRDLIQDDIKHFALEDCESMDAEEIASILEDEE